MLCPEVWNFSPPAAACNFKHGDFAKHSTICDKLINAHHFNHLISVVLPNISAVPDSLTRVLNLDTEYYYVREISVAELVNKEFIETFIKQGHLTALSVDSLIDLEDTLCVTCSGLLVLNLQRDTYLELGLEGRPSVFSSKTCDRYIVTLDLCNASFTPGKNNYERAQDVLKKNIHTFNILLTWEPPNETVCPSSIAKYMHSRGLPIELCKPRFTQNVEQSIAVPVFSSSEGDEMGEKAEDLLEWLGAFLLKTDLSSGSCENYVTSYEPPVPTEMCNDVLVLEWRGFFSVAKIYHFYQLLRKFIETQNVRPWASLHVQGFTDSPLSWGKEEHSFFTEGDNHYTLFLQPSEFLSCSLKSSSKRPQSGKKSKK